MCFYKLYERFGNIFEAFQENDYLFELHDDILIDKYYSQLLMQQIQTDKYYFHFPIQLVQKNEYYNER